MQKDIQNAKREKETVIKHIFSFTIAALCGAGIMFSGLQWLERDEPRNTPVRPSAIVLTEIASVISDLSIDGVHWFHGSKEDAEQIEDAIELIEPSLKILIWKTPGFNGYPIVNTTHNTFSPKGMSMAELEEKLQNLKPE